MIVKNVDWKSDKVLLEGSGASGSNLEATDGSRGFLIQTKLRDGTPIAIRPVTRGDGELIKSGMDHLSTRSRYTRFLHPIARLSEGDVRRFTDVDQTNHIAWGALDLTCKEDFPIGVARCIRLEYEPVAAEIAVAIVDSYQQRGLGTILLAAVAFNAARHGIERLEATVLSENRRMSELFIELDATKRLGSGGVLELTIPIYRSAEDYPDTPTGTAFKQTYRLLTMSLAA